MLISRTFQLTKHENRKISALRSFVLLSLNCPLAQCLGKLLFALRSPFTKRAITNIQCEVLFLPQSYYNIIQMQTHSKRGKKIATDKRILEAGGWRGCIHMHIHTHMHTHLFEDPTNLSNSALGVLLMGGRGRGWWKRLRPGRIDRLAAPNERQACLRNHEGRAVGLQQRS